MTFQKILLAVLLLALARVALGQSDPTPQTPTVSALAKTAKSGTQTFPIRGWGETDEEAQEKALENAWRFMNRSWGPPAPDRWWGLSVQEVRDRFVTAVKPLPKQDKEVVPGKWLKCWEVTLDVTSAQVEELQRQARSRERMALWARFVLLAVLAVAAVGGYLRLEEWAHWRHTFLPRLAGATVLGTVAAGAWWLL